MQCGPLHSAAQLGIPEAFVAAAACRLHTGRYIATLLHCYAATLLHCYSPLQAAATLLQAATGISAQAAPRLQTSPRFALSGGLLLNAVFPDCIIGFLLF